MLSSSRHIKWQSLANWTHRSRLTSVKPVGTPSIAARGIGSWFSSNNLGGSLDQVQGDNAKLEYLRRLVRADPRQGLAAIEKGWAGGSLPTTEEFAKEYCKAAFALKRFDNVDLNALSLMLHSNLAGGASEGGAMSQAQMQQLIAASVMRAGGAGSGAGDTPDRPIFVASRPHSFKDQLWKLLGMGVSTFLILAFLSTLFDAKSVASKMGIASPNSNVKQAEHSDKTFDDVVGVDEAKGELEEIVMYLRDPKRFTRLGGKLPKGVLLTGPPGTGKTLLAKAIAGEASVPFFYSSGSEFEEMYVGVGARRVRDLFAAANANAPCIIFIDEIDAVGGSRNLKDQTAMKMTLNQLLVEMDGFQENSGVIVIGATNFADALDQALVRPGRFDRHIDVPLPDVGGRKAILELYAKKMPLAADVELDQIARGTPGFSGAELFNLMNHAAVKSSVNGDAAISMDMMEWAKDRISMGAERQSAILTPETLKLTATHEAGHALVGLLTEGADPIHKATIIPRGRALGLVLQLPDGDQTSFSLKQMMARLDVCMGGRIAEELVFGRENVTSGASSDIQQATRLARSMVTKYGLSDEIGAVFINNDPSQTDRGNSISNDTLRSVDKEIKKLLDDSYARVTRLLTENRAKLENIAAGLMKYETLAGSEVVEVMNTGRLSDETGRRSQKPSRELKEIPTEGLKKRKPLPPAPKPAPQALHSQKQQPPARRSESPLSNRVGPATENTPARKTDDRVPPDPFGAFSSWFGGVGTPTSDPSQQAGVGVPMPQAGQQKSSTVVTRRNVNGRTVEEHTTTTVVKNPQTGQVTTTTTRRIRGPPTVVGGEEKSAGATAAEKVPSKNSKSASAGTGGATDEERRSSGK